MKESPIHQMIKELRKPSISQNYMTIGKVSSISPLQFSVGDMLVDSNDIYRPINMTYEIGDNVSIYVGEDLIVIGKVTI